MPHYRHEKRLLATIPGPSVQETTRRPISMAALFVPSAAGRYCLAMPLSSLSVSVSVMLGLERALNRDADIFGLVLVERGKPTTESLHVYSRNSFVEDLR